MQVLHRLPGVLAAVVDDAEARVEALRQLGDNLKAFGDIGRILRRDILGAGDMELRHHEEMDRRLGVQVVEGDDLSSICIFACSAAASFCFFKKSNNPIILPPTI